MFVDHDLCVLCGLRKPCYSGPHHVFGVERACGDDELYMDRSPYNRTLMRFAANRILVGFKAMAVVQTHLCRFTGFYSLRHQKRKTKPEKDENTMLGRCILIVGSSMEPVRVQDVLREHHISVQFPLCGLWGITRR